EKINSLYNNIQRIGSGTFGEVYKVRHKFTNKISAIKMTDISALAIRELQMLLQVQSQYVVTYYSFWSDNNSLFIEMEYCQDSLQNILIIRFDAFNRQRGELMNLVEYFIFTEIFRELLECVDYLHTLEIPVIHRDLKPANVLIYYDILHNRRFLKLCDFGLATFQNRSQQSHTVGVGSPKYTPTEVFDPIYDTKRDIYSLAVIAQKMFEISFNG
ncbi:unnamed protein product, partial [Oppiella nova]